VFGGSGYEIICSLVVSTALVDAVDAVGVPIVSINYMYN
jgi:hypothetical protein